MHETSYAIMQNLFNKYLDITKALNILDVGSLVVGKQVISYKDLIIGITWYYTGLDLVAGKNVDIVLEDPYKFPMGDDTYDLVICGQTLEHVEFPHKLITEVYRVVKPGGLIFLVAPGKGKEHHLPDYWRIMPDGMRSIVKTAGFNCLEAFTIRSKWNDVVGVGRKRV